MSHYNEYSHGYFYSTLGNNCIAQTNAITSNTKFLSPLNNVYKEKYTENTLLYPGHEEDNNLNSNSKASVVFKDNKKCKNCVKY